MNSVTALLGFAISDGISVEEYDDWLYNVHYPDLLENPYLNRIILHTITDIVEQTSTGTATAPPPEFGRIAELHFSDRQAYSDYRDWFERNPIPIERGPAGKSVFEFYVLCDSSVFERQALCD